MKCLHCVFELHAVSHSSRLVARLLPTAGNLLGSSPLALLLAQRQAQPHAFLLHLQWSILVVALVQLVACSGL